MRPFSKNRDDEWEWFETLPSLGAAEAQVAMLKSGGVPAKVVTDSLALGLEDGFHVFVATSLLHRAKWLSAESPVSDAELNFLATGELDEVGQGES